MSSVQPCGVSVTPSAPTALGLPPDSDREPLAARIGEHVAGRYVIDSLLATGGMGVVYRAHHVELGHPVAVKFLRPAYANNELIVERFLGEARSLAALESAHVVRVIDVGQTALGAPYLVMEYLAGEDLETLLLRDGALDVESAVDYVLEACEALSEAHRAGIVHRDIKPENLFLAGSEPRRVLKVVDFGIAKRLDAGRAKVVTGPQDSMGSPCYMSPEQMASPRAVDARTDIWSLGVVLYRLLTGALPFDGDSLVEVFARVAHAEAPALGDVRPGLETHLDRIVHRCLEKDPDRRYPSIASLAADLEQYRSGALSKTSPFLTPAPASVRMPSEAPVAVDERGPGKHRRFGLASIAAAAAVAAIAGTALRPALVRTARSVRAEASAAFERRVTMRDARIERAPGILPRFEPAGFVAARSNRAGFLLAEPELSDGAADARAAREKNPRAQRAPAPVDSDEALTSEELARSLAPYLEPEDPPAPAPAPALAPAPAPASAPAPALAPPPAPAEADPRAAAEEREAAYRDYLKQHGWRPLRDVLDEMRAK